MKNKYIMYKLVPVICDGQHFTHMKKKHLHDRTISLGSEGGGSGPETSLCPTLFILKCLYQASSHNISKYVY